MRLEEKEELLSRVELFEALTPERLRRLSLVLPVVSYRGGQLLHGPEHRSAIFYLLLWGRVRVYRASGAGDTTLYYVRAGDVFGEGVFGDVHGPRGTFAQTIEDSLVALVHVGTFRRIVFEDPAVGLKMVELLDRRLSFYADRIADIGIKSVTGRLAVLVRHLAESEGLMTSEGYKIPVRYTHQQLGEMIGAKRVAVTRALAELREAGAIAVERRQIRVRDPGVLDRVAGGR